jgi:hypothetical protein
MILFYLYVLIVFSSLVFSIPQQYQNFAIVVLINYEIAENWQISFGRDQKAQVRELR